jgi:hypothetical protein
VTSDAQRLREIPRAQRWVLERPLSAFGAQYGTAREAIARAHAFGVYTMREIIAHFGVHQSTVSRAMRRRERGDARLTVTEASHRMQMSDFTT